MCLIRFHGAIRILNVRSSSSNFHFQNFHNYFFILKRVSSLNDLADQSNKMSYFICRTLKARLSIPYYPSTIDISFLCLQRYENFNSPTAYIGPCSRFSAQTPRPLRGILIGARGRHWLRLGMKTSQEQRCRFSCSQPPTAYTFPVIMSYM